MNRLHQLKKTFLKNLSDIESYDNVEVILLDYNSKDGMAGWVFGHLSDHVLSGKVSYYRTTEPTCFKHSHAKNLAFKLATGDIVCNINADHYIGKGFAEYVNAFFNADENIVLTTVDYFGTEKNYMPPKDVFGKVCVMKKDFLSVGGFDERMCHYGFEDWDFVNRLERTGLKRSFIYDPHFLEYISHEEEERYLINDDSQMPFTLYINYIDPSSSEIILLYENSRYERGILIDNTVVDSLNWESAFLQKGYKFEYSLNTDIWLSGTWENDNRYLTFRTDEGNITQLKRIDKGKKIKNEQNTDTYYLVTDSTVKKSIATFNYFLPNRYLMEMNLKNETILINSEEIGVANDITLYPFNHSWPE